MFTVFTFSNSILRLLVYLLQSYAIYRLASVRNLPNPVFAFIPFFRLYMLGMIGDSLKYMNRQVNDLFGRIQFSLALPIISIATSILAYPFNSIASLLLSFAQLLMYYLIFSFYVPRLCTLFTAICALPTVVLVLSILSQFPLFGLLFGVANMFVVLAATVTPVVAPLLILYSIRGRR